MRGNAAEYRAQPIPQERTMTKEWIQRNQQTEEQRYKD